jgi:DNA invertase Pin-like site-specific DNA recombinase
MSFAALADFERSLIPERTFAGLSRTRPRPRRKPPAKVPPQGNQDHPRPAQIEIAARRAPSHRRSTLYRAVLKPAA